MKRFLFVLALVACVDLTAPAGAVRIHPVPQQYKVWWGELEQCSGLRKHIDNAEFYIVEDIDGTARGITLWRIGSKSLILIVRGYEDSEAIVKHEMMHVLGDFHSHPPEYFNGRCGNLYAP